MKAALNEVSVIIDEAWKREPALQINDVSLRIYEPLDFDIRADGDDTFAARRCGFSPWLRLVAGPDAPVDHCQFGNRTSAGEIGGDHLRHERNDIGLLAVVNGEHRQE